MRLGALTRDLDGTDGAARRWDDGVILPEDTRTVLGLSLGVISKSWRPEQREQVGNFGVFRM